MPDFLFFCFLFYVFVFLRGWVFPLLSTFYILLSFILKKYCSCSFFPPFSFSFIYIYIIYIFVLVSFSFIFSFPSVPCLCKKRMGFPIALGVLYSTFFFNYLNIVLFFFFPFFLLPLLLVYLFIFSYSLPFSRPFPSRRHLYEKKIINKIIISINSLRTLINIFLHF